MPGSSLLDANASNATSKASSTNLVALGRIVPDREAFRRDLLATVSSQGSYQSVTSTASLDGLAQAAPGCTPPLPLLSPNGLSRTQFIIAGQAASLPCVPTYNHAQGGVVLDRVLASTGRDSWWAALTGRLRLQKLLRQKRTKGWKKSFQDPANYALAANSLGRLPDGTLLRTRFAYQPHNTSSSGSAGSATQHTSSGSGAQSGKHTAVTEWLDRVSEQLQHVAGAAQLRRPLGASSELRADVSVRWPTQLPPIISTATGQQLSQTAKESSTGADVSTAVLPFHAAVEVGTAPGHTGRFQYRVGAHHNVLSEAQSTHRRTSSSVTVAQQQTDSTEQSTASTGITEAATTHTHVHATMALQGSKLLWSGSAASRRQADAKRKHGSVGGGGAKGKGKGASAHDGAAPGQATDSGQQPPRGKVLGPHNPIRKILQSILRPQGNGKKDEDHASDLAAPSLAHRSTSSANGSKGSTVSDTNGHTNGHTQYSWESLLPQPADVQEAVLDATQSIKRLREDVQTLTDWVSSGGLADKLDDTFKNAPGAQKRSKPKRKDQPRVQGATKPADKASPSHTSTTTTNPPWSSLVGAPHIRLGGLIGIHMQQPLIKPARPPTQKPPLGGAGAPALAGPGGAAGPAAAAAAAAASAQDALARANSLSLDLVRASVAWLASAWSPRSSLSVREGKGRRWGSRHQSARLFSSVGISAQAGWFQRAVLDYTRVTARLDLGVPGAGPAGSVASGRVSVTDTSHSSWTSLTLSLVQQLIGPVRLCVDTRCALTPVPSLIKPLRATAQPTNQAETVKPPATAASGQQPQQRGRLSTLAGAFNRLQQAATDKAISTARNVRAVRPQLVDYAVGLDVTVPGSAGFIRLSAWTAPLRGEAMAEIRLL